MLIAENEKLAKNCRMYMEAARENTELRKEILKIKYKVEDVPSFNPDNKASSRILDSFTSS